MPHRIRLFGLILLVCLLSGPLAASSAVAQPGAPWATGDSRGEDLVVRLVTFGPGEAIHQYFGHTGVEVRDERLDVSALYNFGLFDFGAEMLPRFLSGRLRFWVGAQAPLPTYVRYARSGRAVRMLELNLAPHERLALAEALADAVRPENRYYRYHHYDDNCATRIADTLDRVLGGRFARAYAGPARMSLREHTRRYAAKDPLIDWALVFLMNDDMERPIRAIDEVFLPDELERKVKAFHRPRPEGGAMPLAGRERVFARARGVAPVPEEPPVTWPFTSAIGGMLGTGSAALGWWQRRNRKRRAPRLLLGLVQLGFGLSVGLLGLILALLSGLTEHVVTYWNENLLLANPLTFLAGLSGIGTALGRPAALRWGAWLWLVLSITSIAAVALKVLPAFDQDNLLVWTLLLPANLGFAFAARQLLAQERTAISPPTRSDAGAPAAGLGTG